MQLGERFVDPPSLQPAHPQAGQPVFLQIRSGQCDAFLADRPEYPKITVTGQTIHMLLSGGHAGDGILRNFPISTNTVPLGRFQSGTYAVEAQNWVRVDLGDNVYNDLGTLSLVVSQAAAIPTIGAGFAILLVIYLFVLALRNRSAAMTIIVTTAAFAAHSDARPVTPNLDQFSIGRGNYFLPIRATGDFFEHGLVDGMAKAAVAG